MRFLLITSFLLCLSMQLSFADSTPDCEANYKTMRSENFVVLDHNNDENKIWVHRTLSLSKKFYTGFVIEFLQVAKLDKSGMIVTMCDDVTGYEQGNCLEFYYFSENNSSKHIAVLEMPHSGGDEEVRFFCELH
jgi:hypothetical protein